MSVENEQEHPFNTPDDYWWKRYGDIHDGLIPKLTTRLVALEGERAIEHAWDEFHAPLEGDAPSFLEHEGSFYRNELQLVWPWALYEWVPRSLKAKRHPVAMEYLKSTSANRFEKTFIETLCFTPSSFYEVVKVFPGLGLRIKDVFSGEVVDVGERAGSKMIDEGSTIYGRVARLSGINMFCGMSSVILGPIDRLEVLKLKRTLEQRPGKKKDEETNWAEVLLLCELLPRTVYLHLREKALHPPPVILQNTDGDRFEFHSMEFSIRCDVATAAEKLRDLCAHCPEDPFEEYTENKAGVVTKVHIKWSKLGNGKNKSWTNTTLGHIEIVPASIEASVNSAKRAKTLRKILEERLGDDVEFVSDQIKSQDELRREAEAKDKSKRPSSASEKMPPEMVAIAREMGQRHWESWLDTKIPILGYRTPRSAAKTQAGREMLEALLQDFKMKSDLGPREMTPDIAWLRESLGMERS